MTESNKKVPILINSLPEYVISDWCRDIQMFSLEMPHITCDNPMQLMTMVAQKAKERGKEIDKPAQKRMWYLANAIGIKPHPIYDYIFFGKIINLPECARAGFFPTDLIALDALERNSEMIAELARTGWGSLNINKMINHMVKKKNEDIKKKIARGQDKLKLMTDQEMEIMRNGLLYAFMSARAAYLKENEGKDLAGAAVQREANRIKAEKTALAEAKREENLKRLAASIKRELDQEEEIRKKQEKQQIVRESIRPTFADLFREKGIDANSFGK